MASSPTTRTLQDGWLFASRIRAVTSSSLTGKSILVSSIIKAMAISTSAPQSTPLSEFRKTSNQIPT